MTMHDVMIRNTHSMTDPATILIVDDDDNVRNVMRAILLQCGYAVLEARSGREALRISLEHRGRIDLLLTDVMMPEMNGPQLAELISRRHPSSKLLYVSGCPADALGSNVVLKCEAPLIAKPFTAAELTRHVRKALFDADDDA